MKAANKKIISLLAALSVLMAYTLPFCRASFADDTYTAEPRAVNDSLGLTTISENYTFIAQTALADKNITANMGAAEKLNDYVYGRGKYLTNKGNSTIGDEECLNVFGLKYKDYYIAFNVAAGATVSVYGKNSGSDTRYFAAGTAVNKKDIAVSDVFGKNELKTFTFTVENDETVYVTSYQVAAGADEAAESDGGGDTVIAGFTVTFEGGDDPQPSVEPTGAPTPSETPTEAPKPSTDPTEAPKPSTDPTEAPKPSTDPTEAPKPSTDPTEAPKPSVKPTDTPKPTQEPSDLSPDEKAVRADAAALEIKAPSKTSIYFDIDLDKNGESGSAITWESSNTKYIDIKTVSHVKRNYTGVVTRPTAAECTDGGVPVTLTATLKKGSAEYKKTFNVSVREWNPTYYNDFQSDVGRSETDGTYRVIEDNVTAVNGEKFRGIRVDTLKESSCFEAFAHNDKDKPLYIDKRVISTDEKYGKARSVISGDTTGENFAFYYGIVAKYGGDSAIPLWIKLVDSATNQAPQGIAILTMDLYVINGQQISMGLGTSKPAQMCRFMMGNKDIDSKLGYDAVGYLRYYDNEAAADFMGGDAYYRCPAREWVKAVIVANSQTHKWDLYFDGMQIAEGLNFRNAQDMFSTIEFMPDRNSAGGKFLIDNICVENITSDYKDTYWESLELENVSYDEEKEAYTANSSFLLPYQGTGGLAGNLYSWKSSNEKALKIETKRIPVDELENYGYTAAQIAAYKNSGVTNPIVVLATPQAGTDETPVTLTAKMQIDGETKVKEFKVLVSSASSGEVTGDRAKAKEDAEAISCVHTGDKITSNISLEKKGAKNNSDIVWKSSNESVIKADGTVRRPSDGAVTVTLTASVRFGDAVEYKSFNVTVQPTASGGSGGGGGGGSSNSGGSGGVTLPFNLSTPAPVTQQPTQTTRPSNNEAFADVYKVEWAREAIEYLFAKDVINGYGDGTFGVNDNVTREQFVRMLLTALDIKLTSDGGAFKDVAEDEWYSNYVNTAMQLGIVSGVSEDTFGVGEAISRQDMAVMCRRALELVASDDAEEIKETAEPEPTAEPEETSEPELTSEPEETAEPEPTAEPEGTPEPEEIPELGFKDKDSIAGYAMRAVALMAHAGYLSGNDEGNFAPQKSLTRAEAAVVLYRIMTEGK